MFIVLTINKEKEIDRHEFYNNHDADAYYEEISQMNIEDLSKFDIIAGVYLDLDDGEYFMKDCFYNEDNDIEEIDDLFLTEMYELQGELDDNN